MSKLMEQAVERLRSLPESRQDDLASAVMMLAEDESGPFELTPDDAAAIAQARVDIELGDIATDEEIRAVWATRML